MQTPTFNLIGLFNKRATADHMEGCLLLILSGSYLGFLPDYYVASRAERYPLRRLQPDTFSYEVENAITFKKDARNSPVIDRFIAELLLAMAE